jgi:hypothetical protein
MAGNPGMKPPGQPPFKRGGKVRMQDGGDGGDSEPDSDSDDAPNRMVGIRDAPTDKMVGIRGGDPGMRLSPPEGWRGGSDPGMRLSPPEGWRGGSDPGIQVPSKRYQKRGGKIGSKKKR